MNFKIHELKMFYGTLPNQSTEALYAFAPRCPAPVGFVWFTQDFGAVNIGYIFVNERYRRCGIATSMLNQLKAWYPTSPIATEVGNKFSTPWLVKHGFVHCTKPVGLKGWFILPPYNSAPAPAQTATRKRRS